jgi:hypothetical protein
LHNAVRDINSISDESGYSRVIAYRGDPGVGKDHGAAIGYGRRIENGHQTDRRSYGKGKHVPVQIMGGRTAFKHHLRRAGFYKSDGNGGSGLIAVSLNNIRRRDVNAYFGHGLGDPFFFAHQYNTVYDSVVPGGFDQKQIFDAFAACNNCGQGMQGPGKSDQVGNFVKSQCSQRTIAHHVVVLICIIPFLEDF